MSKLIELDPENKLVCDNPNCNYETTAKYSVEDLYFLIGLPCPKCDHNLLTQEDYNRWYRFVKSVKFLNRWFGWLTWFFKKNKNVEIIEVGTHNEITFRKKD